MSGAPAPATARDPWLWRCVIPCTLAVAAVLLFVGLDGDDYYFYNAVRRLSPAEFFHIIWPVKPLTFRSLSIGTLWLHGWMPSSTAGLLRLTGAVAVVPTAGLLYLVTKRLVCNSGAATAFATLWTLLSASFPFPWSYAQSVWAPLWFFLGLWCWLRWWDRPTGVRLGAALLTNALGLLNSEVQLALTPVAYLAIVCVEGPGAWRRIRGARLIGLGAGVAPLLVYCTVRFGVYRLFHYYGSTTTALGFTGGTWVVQIPRAYVDTALSLWSRALGLGIEGAAGAVTSVTLACAFAAAGATRVRSLTRADGWRIAAALGIAGTMIVPFTGLAAGPYEVYATWGLALAACMWVGPPRMPSLIAGTAILVLAAGAAVPRTLVRARRANFLRTVSSEIRRVVPQDGRARWVLVRGLPGTVAGVATATTLDSFVRSVLPWPQARVTRAAPWSDSVGDVQVSLMSALPEPPPPPRPDTLAVFWDGRRLLPDPRLPPLLLHAVDSVTWRAGGPRNLLHWRPDPALRRVDHASPTFLMDRERAQLTSAPLRLPEQRFSAMRVRMSAVKPGIALVRLTVIARIEVGPQVMWPALSHMAPADGTPHDVWFPLAMNPYFGQFSAPQELTLRVNAPPGTRVQFEEVSLLP